MGKNPRGSAGRDARVAGPPRGVPGLARRRIAQVTLGQVSSIHLKVVVGSPLG